MTFKATFPSGQETRFAIVSSVAAAAPKMIDMSGQGFTDPVGCARHASNCEADVRVGLGRPHVWCHVLGPLRMWSSVGVLHAVL